MANCEARAYDCHCGLPGPHPLSPHECSVPGCLARWRGEPSTFTFVPITMPTWPLLPLAFTGPRRPALRLVKA